MDGEKNFKATLLLAHWQKPLSTSFQGIMGTWLKFCFVSFLMRSLPCWSSMFTTNMHLVHIKISSEISGSQICYSSIYLLAEFGSIRIKCWQYFQWLSQGSRCSSRKIYPWEKVKFGIYGIWAPLIVLPWMAVILNA